MNNFNEFFKHTYIYPGYTKYQDYEFYKLISSYLEIEKEIASDIQTIIRYFFSFHDYTFIGMRFHSKGNSFICSIQFIESTRELRVYFTDDRYQESSIKEIRIEHFGAIRNVVMFFPYYLDKVCKTLSIVIEKYIQSAYTNIEKAVKDKFEHIADKICNRVNVWLNSHLISIGKEHLTESVKFFVFQKDAGLFYFDKYSYVKVIDHFKQNQNDIFSPYELAVWLLTNPLPFSKSLSAKSFEAHGMVLSQEWNEAMFVDERNFFESARKLYEVKPYAVFSVYRSPKEEFSLSIAFKRADKAVVVPILQDIKFSVIEEFNNSIGVYSSFIKKFDLLKIKETIWTNPDKLGSFTGSALASFFKIISHAH
jgi:hypothetical protein